jgi:hypothetical protein
MSILLGAFAPAVSSDDTPSCYSPGPSNVQTTGTWERAEVNTNIPATVQTVLTSNVRAGSTNSVTWNVYTSASGLYDVYLLVPGCLNMQDCDSRTSVDVTINPGGSLSPVTTTVSEQTDQDVERLVYSGPIFPTGDGYTVPIKLQLAAQPTGTGSGGQYTIVADRIIMKLTSADVNGGGNGTSSNGSSGTKRGFGIYEWPLRNSPSNVNATGVIPNNTETSLTNLSFSLFSGLGSSSASASQNTIYSIIPLSSDKTFVGGRFRLSGGIENVAQYSGGQLSALANQGIGGTVNSMVLYGNALFVGGSFNSTADDSVGLRNIAWYNIDTNQWSSLGGGLDGAVASLELSNGHLNVVGNFTHTLISSSESLTASGLATWDIAHGKWIHSGGLLVGKMSALFNATSGDDGSEYIAGTVSMYLKYGADGAASFSNGENGQADITPLGARLDGQSSAPKSNAKRSGWGLNIRGLLAPRQSTGIPIPEDGPVPAPSVLSGIFWTNTTSSRQVMIIGGNFTVPGTSTTSLAIYDPEDESATGLQGSQIDGVVRSLLVVGSKLYVGGEFSLQGVEGQSFAVYDLSAQAWVSSVPGLTGMHYY